MYRSGIRRRGLSGRCVVVIGGGVIGGAGDRGMGESMLGRQKGERVSRGRQEGNPEI